MRLPCAAAAIVLLISACESEAARARRGLSSPDLETRLASAEKLGELRDHDAVPRLAELLRDTIPALRAEAAYALGRIGDRRAVEPLWQAVAGETTEAVVLVQAQALASHRVLALDQLIRLLRHPLPAVRVIAARALGQTGASRAVDWLIAMLDDPAAKVRRAAAGALRQIGDPRGTEALMHRVERPAAPGDEAAGDEFGDE
ncbi:HEAT repeat domain-containing protein, partial [candidate division WOR-3 bacterium]|nr:HEAT repeat domain-containing protein [candidate division WOR-3 bacterium]